MDAMAASGEYGELVFAGKPINRADFERVVVNREDDAEVGKKVDKDIEAAVKHNRDNTRSINENTLSEWKHSIRISRLGSSTTGIICDRSTRKRSVNGSIHKP